MNSIHEHHNVHSVRAKMRNTHPLTRANLGAIDRAENAFTAERLEAATIRAAMDDMVWCIGCLLIELRVRCGGDGVKVKYVPPT